MRQDITIQAYFTEHVPEHNRVRTINCLVRGGISTMDELCHASMERLVRVRNMGEKTREIALAMRDKYAAENQITLAKL